MNLHSISLPQVIRTLGQVNRWLDKAQEHAEQKKFDLSVLLGSRLAPDQYNFTRQVQSMSDGAKGMAARLIGEESPSFPDTETTVAELRARVDKTVAYLKGLKPEQFDGASERRVTLSFLPGKYMLGVEYLVELALPNFYFHAASAYAILRHNGVDLGKRDFLGDITLRDL